MKHSVGPFEAILDKTLTQIVAADGFVVADITEDHPDIQEQHANAVLLAAAPEMLAVLKYAADVIGTLKVPSDDPVGSLYNVLRRAIAMAEGTK